jgi:hypothetical protein
VVTNDGFEINLKLAQANAICIVAGMARDIHADGTIAHALHAATDLIEESQKAFKELWETVIKKTHSSTSQT